MNVYKIIFIITVIIIIIVIITAMTSFVSNWFILTLFYAGYVS